MMKRMYQILEYDFDGTKKREEKRGKTETAPVYILGELIAVYFAIRC